jgi:hypothetical protein
MVCHSCATSGSLWPLQHHGHFTILKIALLQSSTNLGPCLLISTKQHLEEDGDHVSVSQRQRMQHLQGLAILPNRHAMQDPACMRCHQVQPHNVALWWTCSEESLCGVDKVGAGDCAQHVPREGCGRLVGRERRALACAVRRSALYLRETASSPRTTALAQMTVYDAIRYTRMSPS